jgi:hypothetical protein
MKVPVRHLDCILQKMPFGEEEEEEKRPAPSWAARPRIGRMD